MFKTITAEELNDNVFKMIGKDWLLVTAEKDGKANTMTASWGGVGVLWGSDVVYIFVRQSRYTKEFIDKTLFVYYTLKVKTLETKIINNKKHV